MTEFGSSPDKQCVVNSNVLRHVLLHLHEGNPSLPAQVLHSKVPPVAQSRSFNPCFLGLLM